jgi:hypothetical protein
MNAIAPEPPKPDERTQRHLAMCQELAEIGMQLVRAVAQKAMQDLAEDEPQAKGPKNPTRP